LRASFGPGPNAMNELVVIQAAQGLCVALEKELGQDAARARVSGAPCSPRPPGAAR